MLPSKLNQLLNNVADHVFGEMTSRLASEVRAAKFDFARRGLSISGAAEKRIFDIHVTEMQKAADQIWNELKRVMQEIHVQPTIENESEICTIVRKKLARLLELIQQFYAKNLETPYRMHNFVPLLEPACKRMESKVSNEVSIFFAGLQARKLEKEENRMPSHITYNLTGNNPRVNINSQDHSINIQNSKVVFDEVRKTIFSQIEDDKLKSSLEKQVAEMESNVGKPGFMKSYSDFVALAANHMAIFGPLLPALTQLLQQHC